ncbi:melanopsin-like [Oculina patagonica]
MNISTNLSEENYVNKATENFTTNEIIAGSVIIVVLMLSAIIGNVLTCLIICRRPSFRTPTYISILFFCISDVVMAGLVMPFSLASLIRGRWLFSSKACTIHAFISHYLLGASFITMACTAIIRYLCVVKPALHHQYVKQRTVTIVISTLWLAISIVEALTIFFKSAYGIYVEKRLLCVFEYNAKNVGETKVFAALAFAFIVALVIFVAYFKVFRFVTHHNHAVASNLQQPSTSHTEEAKITKTLVTVVLGFVFCWAPIIVIQFIDMIAYSHFEQFRMPNFVFLLQTICIFASSAINPFIYGFTNKRFRKQYVELLGVLCPSAPQVAPVGNGSS